jgi:hypothetical protein
MSVTGRIAAILGFLLLSVAGASADITADCKGGVLAAANPPQTGRNAENLIVTGACYLAPNRNYYFSKINVVANGALIFDEVHGAPAPGTAAHTNLWTSSIIIENGGKVVAGNSCSSDGKCTGRFGQQGADLTIRIYGRDVSKWDRTANKFANQNTGATCYGQYCGVPKATWDTLHYEPLYGDAKCTDNQSIWTPTASCPGTSKVGYFGSKVLAVSYGGTLDLQGYKGASDESGGELAATDSGLSWMRLADSADGANENFQGTKLGSLEPGQTTLYLERAPNAVANAKNKWDVGDEIVVTTTDYLPGHSEKLKITKVDNTTKITFSDPIKYSHNSRRYGGPKDDDGNRWAKTNSNSKGRLPDRLIAKADGSPNNVGGALDPDLVASGAETRAAVALLSRSIRIISAGNDAGVNFPTALEADGKTVKPCKIINEALGTTDGSASCYYFGAQFMVREGFSAVHVSGVEFKQMGQGGRMGHYPVHFHMVHKAPAGTYVKDSSINESMTRWIVLHNAQNVTLARNVGYLSIGHGFYLEDAAEANNQLYSNIGIFARAAINNDQNTRKVPGILALNSFDGANPPDTGKFNNFIYRSDVFHPTVFWITNGWNDFVGNMAVGANACGAGYWLIPAFIKDMGPKSEAEVGGYETYQWNLDHAGAAPLKTFYKNYATTAMHSFQTTPDAPDCMDFGFGPAVASNYGAKPIMVRGVLSDAPTPKTVNLPDEPYYPHVAGEQRPTLCGETCKNVLPCGNGSSNGANCVANVIDHFTSAYHWAHGNVSAIWLRYKWFLVDNSVLSDVQQGGITFVTGGDFTQSSVALGYWGLARNSVFVGNTRDNGLYPYSSNKGPYPTAEFTCETGSPNPAFCINSKVGVSMRFGGFFTNQRLANIYDGPSYQDSVAYLDVKSADCDLDLSSFFNKKCMYATPGSILLLRRNRGVNDNKCYIPNAAIGWKQPNGFYYAPAFHVHNAFFDDVDIRHFVINPLFAPPGKYKRNANKTDWVPNTDFKGPDFGQGGTYLTDTIEAQKEYCVGGAIFNGYSAIDRQTELNDDDGSLTGLSNDFNDANYPDPRLKQTISVNQDVFFDAPVDTPECASAREPVTGTGNTNPNNACLPIDPTKPAPTARTSPYDYVSTVIASNYNSADNHERDPPWSKECTNENCYGVPLYRQYLTAAENTRWQTNCAAKTDAERASGGADAQECRWPYIRMAGMAIGARQTMTVNNGLYYVDTTKSQAAQDTEDLNFTGTPRTYSVFTPRQSELVDGKFYFFFVYAKQSTVQTYDIYVGKNFKITNDLTSDLKLSHTKMTGIQWKPQTTEEALPNVSGGVGSGKWIASATLNDSGILRVTLNFKDQTELNPVTSPNSCRPLQFCSRVGDACGANKSNPAYADAAKFNKALATEIDYVCQKWAVKEMDCPEAGCYGFTIQLHDVVADDKYRRPAPEVFPTGAVTPLAQGAPSWATKFKNDAVPAPDNASGGQCYYPRLPPCRPPG